LPRGMGLGVGVGVGVGVAVGVGEGTEACRMRAGMTKYKATDAIRMVIPATEKASGRRIGTS
jgi:hypothetical protein